MAKAPGPNDRTRKRRNSVSVDREEIVNRVMDFYEADKRAKDVDRDARLQRHAKLRMWTEGKDWPWPNASDLGLPDILEKSLRIQDTIHNAVMSTRPPITPTATNPADQEKEEIVEKLIDHQVFVSQNGEHIVGELADAFTNDGVFTAFIPWVKEFREVSEVFKFEKIPDEIDIPSFLRALTENKFREEGLTTLKQRMNGWEYDVTVQAKDDISDSNKFRVQFFTEERTDRLEMVVQREVKVYDGPRIIVKDYDDVLHPPRAANLQAPTPSNPHGAAHVILRDSPTVDEIRRLAKSKFYDLMSKEDLDSLEDRAGSMMVEDDEEDQRDVLGGENADQAPDFAKEQNRITRLTVFDIYDLDGDGIAEDVVWWVLVEPKILVKAKLLTEMYPSNPPRRPFAEASFIPIRGRRAGISVPELVEPLHDAMKTILDQGIDSGTLSNVPFFFYRATGTVKPEVLSLEPGFGYPTGDPKRDIEFPQLGNGQAQGFALNLTSLLSQMEERLTLIGDFSLGRVPAGRSAALRTTGNMAMLAGQAESRPERILRRFFNGLSEMWAQIHELNQVFLPRDTQIRATGGQEKSKDPYLTVAGANAVRGRFQFTFSANVFNTSKQALQQSLGALMTLYLSPIAIQAGVIDQTGIYRLARDYGKSFGQDADKYLKPPHPFAMKRPIFAEEVIQSFMQETVPDGRPAEAGGAEEHLQKLAAFMDSDDFGYLSQPMAVEFGNFVKSVARLMELEKQQQQLAESAAQTQTQGQNATGRPAENLPEEPSQPQVSSGNELMDETLPTAGGGGNTQTLQ